MVFGMVGGDLWTQETGKGEKAVEASNAFAMDLYGVLREGKGNVVCSPVGLHSLLMLIQEGASGETLEELKRGLHWKVEGEERFDEVRALRGFLVMDAGAGRWLQSGQYLWLSEQRWIRPVFMKTAEEVFGLSPRAMDFTDPARAIREINGLVARDTRQRIPSFLGEGAVTKETRMVAASTLYLKGNWGLAFDPRESKQGMFQTLSPGVSKPVMMMQQESDLRGFMNDRWQAVELPFDEGMEGFAMTFLLPRVRGGLAGLEVGLSTDLLKEVHSTARTRKVLVRIPRFSFSMVGSYRESVGRLGIKRVFEQDRAELQGISPEPPPFLGDEWHEATVEVNEVGAEASAATAVPAAPFGPGDGEEQRDQTRPMIFNADHPFVFVVRHRLSGLVLFMGRVAEP